MNLKRVIILLIGMVSLIISLGAQQMEHRMGRDGQGMRDPMMMMKMLEARQEALKISDAQMKELKALALSSSEQNVLIQNKNNLLKLELDKLLSQDSKDYDKIKSAMAKISENKIEQRLNHMKARESLQKILTPEQLEQIKGHMQQNMGKRGQRSHGFKGDSSRRNRPGRD